MTQERTETRAALAEFLRSRLPLEDLNEASRLIAAYVAAAVREERRRHATEASFIDRFEAIAQRVRDLGK